MTATSLRSMTCKELGQIAKNERLPGWHAMRKEELVTELVKAARRKSRAAQRSARATAKRSASPKTKRNASSTRRRRTPQRLKQFQMTQDILKRISSNDSNGTHDAPQSDRLIAMVRGPYWLHALWDLQRKSVERAAAALGQRWHTAQPVLRLLTVTDRGSANTTEEVIRDIVIHGGVRHWHIDVADPPCSFRLDIGYLAEDGQYYSLARSSIVSTPAAGEGKEMGEDWNAIAQNCDKIFSMSGGHEMNGSAGDLKELFEERLRRPMGSPMVTRYGIGADGSLDDDGFSFELDAEMIVFGTTSPDAHITLKGHPIELRDDGSFTIRTSLPERRQVIPVVATRADGVEQRTIVLAVERNTKKMEPLIREPATV